MEEEHKKLAEELLGESPGGSFVKALFGGADIVLSAYPEAFSDEGWVDRIRGFSDKFIDADRIDREAKVPEGVIRGLGAMGALGLTIGKEWDGQGVSQKIYCKMMEELASHCGSTAILVNAHHSIGLKSVLLFGSEEQKKKWLPPLARGEMLAAFSLTEPNAGSDAAGIETHAVFVDGMWVLNGEKQWTTNGSIAGMLTVMAKVKGKVTAFIVTPDMEGFEILDPAQEKVGIRGTRTTNLRLNNVKVPDENRLGEVGQGLRICLTALDYGRVTFGATCTGIAKDLLERAVSYGKDRIQFGKPLVHFELIKEKIAFIAAATKAMEAMTYYTAEMIDRGQEDIMLEAAILKVFASEMLWKIVYEVMQIYGGRSFFTNEPLERIMRDARLNMIGEGANEVLRVFISAVGFREVGTKLQKGNVMSAAKAFLTRPHLGLSKEIESRVGVFQRQVIKLLAKHREGIVDHQLELNRMTDGIIALYTMIALSAKKDESVEATYWMQLACKQFDEAMQRVCDPNIHQVSDTVTGYVG